MTSRPDPETVADFERIWQEGEENHKTHAIRYRHRMPSECSICHRTGNELYENPCLRVEERVDEYGYC